MGRAPMDCKYLFSEDSNVSTDLPREIKVRHSFSVRPPGAAWATKTSWARAAMKRLRFSARSEVTRRCLAGKGETIRMRPESRPGFRCLGGGMPSMPRAGQRMMGCEIGRAHV